MSYVNLSNFIKDTHKAWRKVRNNEIPFHQKIPGDPIELRIQNFYPLAQRHMGIQTVLTPDYRGNIDYLNTFLTIKNNENNTPNKDNIL